MPIPFDQLPIGEGLDPAGNPGAAFFIDRNSLELLEKDGPVWKYDDARFIEEAITIPDAIFEAQGQNGEWECHCYSVRLTADPDEEESLTPPRYGYVFLVFAYLGMGGYVVFDWEWREEDADVPGHPSGWQHAFSRRTWQRT